METFENSTLPTSTLDSEELGQFPVLNSLSDDVHGMLDHSLKEPLSFMIDKIKPFMAALSEMPFPIQIQMRPLILVLLLVFLNGCMSMHQPDYEGDLRPSSYSLSDSDMTDRQKQFSALISDPSELEKSPALKSGIKKCQRERMMKSSEYLFGGAHGVDFQKVLSTYQKAKRTLGIMNFDRYSLKMIQTAQENYDNPEIRKDRDVILVVMGREDHEEIFDIQPLNVESGRIEELTKAYKVILVETDKMSEILHHIRTLEKNGVLKPGNLRGIIIGTHGTQSTLDVGISTSNADKLSRLNKFLMGADQSSLVLAACLTHEGGYKADNIANTLALILNEARVAANPNKVVGLNFSLDDSRRFIRSSLELQNMAGLLSLGLLDETIWLRQKDAIPNYLSYLRVVTGWDIPKEYLKHCLSVGILDFENIKKLYKLGSNPSPKNRKVDPEDFRRIHRLGSKPSPKIKKVSPEYFRRISDCFTEDDDRWEFIESDMTLEEAEGYRALGYHNLFRMKVFYDRKITVTDIQKFFTEAKRQKIDPKNYSYHVTLFLGIHNVPLLKALPFLKKGITDPDKIKRCIQYGVVTTTSLPPLFGRPSPFHVSQQFSHAKTGTAK
jgi:hypothetical protein